jgi:hypothetical protein
LLLCLLPLLLLLWFCRITSRAKQQCCNPTGSLMRALGPYWCGCWCCKQGWAGTAVTLNICSCRLCCNLHVCISSKEAAALLQVRRGRLSFCCCCCGKSGHLLLLLLLLEFTHRQAIIIITPVCACHGALLLLLLLLLLPLLPSPCTIIDAAHVLTA